MSKGLSSASIVILDSELCDTAKEKIIVEYLETFAKFRYPGQWRMAVKLLQYGITLGMRLASKTAPNTASTGENCGNPPRV